MCLRTRIMACLVAAVVARFAPPTTVYSLSPIKRLFFQSLAIALFTLGPLGQYNLLFNYIRLEWNETVWIATPNYWQIDKFGATISSQCSFPSFGLNRFVDYWRKKWNRRVDFNFRPTFLRLHRAKCFWKSMGPFPSPLRYGLNSRVNLSNVLKSD